MPLTLNGESLSVDPTSAAAVTGNIYANDAISPTTFSIDAVAAADTPSALLGSVGTLTFTNDGAFSFVLNPWIADDARLRFDVPLTGSYTYTATQGGETGDATLSLPVDGSALAMTFSRTDVSQAGGADVTRYYQMINGSEELVGRLDVSQTTGVATLREIFRDPATDASEQTTTYAASGMPQQTVAMLRAGGTATTTYDTTLSEDWQTRTVIENGGTFQSASQVLNNGNTLTSTHDFINDPSAGHTLVETDPSGALVANIQSRSDGIYVRNVVDGNGNVILRETTDVGETRGWSYVDRYFAPDGEVQVVITAFDNGDVRTIGYTDGIATTDSVEDVSDRRGWDMRTRLLDEDGVTGFRFTFDNGDMREIDVDDGAVTRVLRTDGLSREWETVEQFFNAGALTNDVIEFDDGVMLTRTYGGAGNFRSRIWEDTEDARPWAEVAQNFSNGVLTNTSVTDDDGDITAEFFDAQGNLTQRRFTDVADNFDWETRLWTYDTEGNVIDIVTDDL